MQMMDGGYGKVVTRLDSINQSIDIILGTAKGSNPVRPDFGIDLMSYIDNPIQNVAILKQEIQQNLNAYLPNITINSIVHEIQESHLNITVYWTENTTGITGELTRQI